MRRQSPERGTATRRYKASKHSDGEFSCEACDWIPFGGVLQSARLKILTAHHVIPVTCDGSHDDENLIVLCPNCHAVAHFIGSRVGKTWYGATTKAELIAQLQRIALDPQGYVADSHTCLRSPKPRMKYPRKQRITPTVCTHDGCDQPPVFRDHLCFRHHVHRLQEK